MFLENTKGTKHDPVTLHTPPRPRQGRCFPQRTLGLSRCSVSVSRCVLSPLLLAFEFWSLSSGSSPFAISTASPRRPPGPRHPCPRPTASRAFYFWPRPVACGSLPSRKGFEPAPFALEARSLSHWTTRKSLLLVLYTRSHRFPKFCLVFVLFLLLLGHAKLCDAF